MPTGNTANSKSVLEGASLEEGLLTVEITGEGIDMDTITPPHVPPKFSITSEESLDRPQLPESSWKSVTGGGSDGDGDTRAHT